MKKTIIILSAILILFINSCKKSDSEKNASVIGKWYVVAVEESPDGPWLYPVYVTAEYVVFNTNGTLSGNEFSSYSIYKIKDAATISMIKSDNSMQDYQYKLMTDTLTMKPQGQCISCHAVKMIMY